jgi:hypothetical protein
MWAEKIGPMVKTSLAGGKNLARAFLRCVDWAQAHKLILSV